MRYQPAYVHLLETQRMRWRRMRTAQPKQSYTVPIDLNAWNRAVEQTHTEDWVQSAPLVKLTLRATFDDADG